jgi:uncharacterized protein (TIGR04255 family)
MNKYPKLLKAPIVEAVFDIRCRLPKECGPDVMKKAVEILRADYPKLGKQVVHTEQLKMEAGKQPEFTASERLLGFRIEKEDKTQIVQLRCDGFTLNRLRPYTSFDELWPEVLRCWQSYAEVTKPTEVTRLALRTINRIELERGLPQLGEAFQIPVGAPIAGMEQSGFLHRWGLLGRHRCVANVTLATRQATDVKVPIILDIDAFKTEDLELEVDSLTRNFLQLRDLKNAIFFGSVSEAQVNRYEPQK